MLSALNNLKIGAKLGVLTGVNLALLVITAIAASVFMIQIGNELKEVAHKDIPITEKLTQLTTHQLEQAIEYERALRMASGGSSQAREKFENAEKRFSELSTKADQEIIELQGMLNDAVVSAGSDKAKAELTDILNRMEGVKANHQKYEEHVDEVFNLISRGLFSEAERLEADIEEEQLALNNELTALLVKIGDFTENALLSVEAHESTALTVMVVLGVIALAIGIGFSIIVTKGISKPIDSFVEAIRLLSGGDTRVAIPCLEQSDEIGDMARGVESIRLSANENMRIRNALDNCQANVMLADPDLNIVYMNNTMVAMMKNAEADLKKDLPNLDTESLLGTCVDVFHKNPAHQRGMIEGLTSAYETSINVGGRTFELIASPVKDSRGERIGTVVEWDDVTEKLARETAAKRTADENQRIRIALDNCQANVMLADPDLNIVYMNNTMVAMMKNAEADLKKDLPNLDTSKLIGTCVDVFHKNPSHQRGMIEALSSAYETTIEVGGRTFDLIASPVVDENGNRLGTVVEWADVTEKLATEREATRVANENMRVRVALDNCAANVMVADNSYDIIYMNQAVLKMMKNAEADLKKDLPSFDANNLIGNSIDNFHKNPAHQRGMLEKLDSIYETSIKVGGRTFDLIANPIVSEAGERLGTVVEWNDVTQELAIQEEVDEVVQAVVSGDFTKSLALEGKDGFMLSLSQAINGLKDNIENVLNDVAEALASLARGDLTNQITADYQGTYETLKQDVNQTTERLAKTVSDIITAANEISNASSEIAAGGTDLSQRTEQQASNLEETAASMEEMATTVKQNAENAQQANQLSITARQTAEGGGDVVSKAVTAMAGIEESSQKVSDIIGVIDEIAFQTNLLALNAAVEAARAGEAGKGFAVVASEVRTLAQRSSEAAKDIKGLILDSDAQVKDGVQLVNQTGESLSEIVDSIKRVADIVSEIAAASGEQATGVEEINTAITNMDEMTQQNAALVEESSANARSLEEQSEHMLEMMGFFNIDGAQTEPAERIPANNGVHNGAKPAAKKAKAENRAPEKSGKPAKPKKAAAASAAPVDDDWEEF